MKRFLIRHLIPVYWQWVDSESDNELLAQSKVSLWPCVYILLDYNPNQITMYKYWTVLNFKHLRSTLPVWTLRGSNFINLTIGPSQHGFAVFLFFSRHVLSFGTFNMDLINVPKIVISCEQVSIKKIAELYIFKIV